jgi:protein-tyrosine phosphatase
MVCLGNICRSPLAEGILASKLPATKFTVDSAGTEIGTLAMLLTHVRLRRQKNHNLDISNQKARQFTASDF